MYLAYDAFSPHSGPFSVRRSCFAATTRRSTYPKEHNAIKNKTRHAMLYNAQLREMRDVLENKGHFVQTDFSPQQIVMIILQFSICKVIPPIPGFSLNHAERKVTYVLASPYNNAGALMICFPSLQRLHLNVSWVSQRVLSLKRKSFRRASTEKCRSMSSFSSTTADERACLFACLWKIFSSMVPVVMKR